MKKSKNLLLVVFVLFLVSSCENNREPEPPANATFKDVSGIFAKRSCKTCHDHAGDETATMPCAPNVYTDVLNNWVLKTPKGATITAANYKTSNLYLALNQTEPNAIKVMKSPAGVLDPLLELPLINKWLEAGAPEK